MSNLALNITHSLSFLKNNLQDINTILKLVEDGSDKIKGVRKSDDGHNGEIRAISSKYRKKIDEQMEDTEFEYDLFQSDMSNIMSNKHSENVIYSLSQYAKFVDGYKKKTKEIKKVYDSVEYDKNTSEQDKDYVTLIGLNKLAVPMCRLMDIQNQVMKRLLDLTNIKKDD